MPRKFVYAPGLPGYGTRGVDGDTGLLGLATYFSAYDGNSDSVTIKSKIIANKELLSNDQEIPGYPERIYQTGDIFIDKNARVFQIDFDETNLYKDTGIFLNTSGFFSEGPPQTLAPEFQRYSNSFETDKFLIDTVYTNSVGDYTQYPTSIYSNNPRYFSGVNYIGSDVAVDLNGWYPFEVWSIGSSDDADAIGLAREASSNTWHFGNFDTVIGSGVRDGSLYLDFTAVSIPGNLLVDGSILGDFVGSITATDLYLPGWLTVDGDASFGNDVYVGGTIYGDLIGSASQVAVTDNTSYVPRPIVVATPSSEATLYNNSTCYIQTQTGTMGVGTLRISGSTAFFDDDVSSYIIAKDGSTYQTPGASFSILAGAGGYGISGAAVGGDTIINAGEGGYITGSTADAALGGNIILSAGKGGDYTHITGTGDAGDGGDLLFFGGLGGDTSSGLSRYGHGGSVVISGGKGAGGGDVSISGGSGYGPVRISGGTPGGGGVEIRGGDSVGDCGSVSIWGGQSSGTFENFHGNINLRTYGTGSQIAGDMLISSGGEIKIYHGTDKFFLKTITTGISQSGRYGLQIDGTGTVTAGSAGSSDIRFKNIDSSISNVLPSLLQLSTIKFNWNELAKELIYADPSVREYGLIAQEVMPFFPELIGENEKDGEIYYEIDYLKFVPVLVQGFKEQQIIIDDKQAQIDLLKTDVSTLLSAVNNLTGRIESLEV